MTATRSSWTWLIMLWGCWRNSCPSSTSTQHDCLYESCSTLVLRCDEPRTGGRQGLAPTRLGGALIGLVSAPSQPTRRLQIFAAAHITWFTKPTPVHDFVPGLAGSLLIDTMLSHDDNGTYYS